MINLYNLVYGKTSLFHYMQFSKIFSTTKFIRRSVDKYIADAYGQSIYRRILFESPRMVCFRDTDSPFVYHFCFFRTGREVESKGLKKEVECELIPV